MCRTKALLPLMAEKERLEETYSDQNKDLKEKVMRLEAAQNQTLIEFERAQSDFANDAEAQKMGYMTAVEMKLAKRKAMIERRKLAVQRRELKLLSGNPLSPSERDDIYDGRFNDLDLTHDAAGLKARATDFAAGAIERRRSRTPTGFAETARPTSAGDMSTLSALERARGSTAGSPMSPRPTNGPSYDQM